MSPTVTAALIYNHRFERNVDRLHEVYGEQFDHVLHLMPFAEAATDRIVPVFESSYRFGNFVAQAVERLLETGSDYYLFAGDDLLLSPRLRSDSIEQLLGVGPDTAFIKGWTSLTETSWWWYHVHRGYAPLEDRHSGVEWQAQLPSYDEAAARFARHGWHETTMGLRNYRIPGPIQLRSNRAAARALLALARGRGSVRPVYPLAMAYSDVFVVPRACLAEFARFVGVLSAAGVFVEVAVPTALLLAAPHVATAQTAGDGVEYWTEADLAEFENEHGRDLARLRASMGATDVLWHHPVKLSRWS